MEFKRYAAIHQIPVENLGKTFQSGMEIFTLTGYRPRATKRPFTATNGRGKTYIFTESQIRLGFKLKSA